MIYPEARLFEIVQNNDNQTHTISNLVEQMWLCIYPRLTIIPYYHGNTFLGHAFKNDLSENEYWIKANCATMKNPQKKENIIKNSSSRSETLTYIWHIRKLPRRGWPLGKYTRSYVFWGTKHITYYVARHIMPAGFRKWHDIKYPIHSWLERY